MARTMKLPFRFNSEIAQAIAEESRRKDIRGTFELLEEEHPQGSQEYVFRHIPTGRCFRFSVVYDSWDGVQWSELDRLDEVTPVEKTITVYEKPKKVWVPSAADDDGDDA